MVTIKEKKDSKADRHSGGRNVEGAAKLKRGKPISLKLRQEILAILAEVYKNTGSALEYRSPFQLLVATALAATAGLAATATQVSLPATATLLPSLTSFHREYPLLTLPRQRKP